MAIRDTLKKGLGILKKYITENLRKGSVATHRGIGITKALQNQSGRFGDIARKIPKDKIDTLEDILGVAKKVEHIASGRHIGDQPSLDYSTGKPAQRIRGVRIPSHPFDEDKMARNIVYGMK